jgi:AcrR family transcriptional regulator
MAFVSTADMPPPPWSSAREKDRVPLSRERIADAALAIVDADGLGGLNMRRLAEELGTGPASLYAHVSGKDELLQLLIDRVAAEVPHIEPDPERWQEQVKDYMRAVRDVLRAHRDLAGAALANIPTGPHAIETMEGLLGILRAGELSDQTIAFASDLLSQYVNVVAYEGSLFEQRMEREPEYFQAIFEYFRALPAERFPHFASLVDAMVGDVGDDDARFEFGIDVLVRGLASFGGQANRTE